MAATVQSPLRSSHNHYLHHHNSTPVLPHSQQQQQQQHQQRRTASSKQRFLAEFSQCLVEFVLHLLPTVEELIVKEDVRKLLERLIRTIEPNSRLLSFGSTANGFSLRGSDMDLCCLIDSDERISASDLVNMLGDLLERETKFHVKPLPHARIPIVKLNLDPSPGLPFSIACDIGFENRLALENTRLLMCYAMIDPARVRTMVLFLKVWSKRRNINSPYQGTLSSYGYVLLVIYFLVHVKNPPVLPNLQQMLPARQLSKEDMHLNGYNIWFFDDIDILRQRWQSSNTETVAELLIDFFKYFSRDFSYNTGVVSIRAGFLKKDSKGWTSEADAGTGRERNRFCIEDPFETDFNVARCVTKDGLFMIRGEFMRASRVLAARPDRATVALTQLCEERRDDELVRAAPPTNAFVPPRLSPAPRQSKYTVDSSPIRRVEEIHAEGSGPQVSRPTAQHPLIVQARSSIPPEHTETKRGKWKSPPREDVPITDPTALEDQNGPSLALDTPMHGKESVYASPLNNKDSITDDERSSDGSEAENIYNAHISAKNSSHASASSASPVNLSPRLAGEAYTAASESVDTTDPGVATQSWMPLLVDRYTIPLVNLAAPKPALVAPSRIDSVRRPMTSTRQSLSSTIPLFRSAVSHQQPLSGVRYQSQTPNLPTVFYETAGRIPTSRCAATYPLTGACISALSSQYDQPPLYHVVPALISPTASLPQHVLMARKRNSSKNDATRPSVHDQTESNTPTTSTTPYNSLPSSPSRPHSQQTTILKQTHTAPTTHFMTSVRNNHSSSISSDNSSSSQSGSPKGFSNIFPTQTRFPHNNVVHEGSSISSVDDYTPDLTFSSSPPASVSAGSGTGSPDSSSISSNYATTPSSTSPPSPTLLSNVTTQHRGRSLSSLKATSNPTSAESASLTIGSRLDGRGNTITVCRQELGLR